jgi:dTDP-4-dehydrorhamnose reductase
MRVIVLGASGMLGNAVFKIFSESADHEVWGTLRSASMKQYFPERLCSNLKTGIDILDHDALVRTFLELRPQLVINCVGLIKQLADANDPLTALPVNALLPHKLGALCKLSGARLIHVSTDCVFTGRKGNYVEADVSDAEDLYGKSKYIGEVHDQSHVVTLRTSIIGHELNSKHALVDWFMSQERQVKGYVRAIFSGLPTVELARIMRDVVASRPNLRGLYHVSAQPIAKYDLLLAIAKEYGKEIEIVPDDKVAIDRSLDSSRFTSDTGYVAPDWASLIKLMHQDT